MKEITPEMLNLAAMYLNSTSTRPKKIKVKSQFADYLERICSPVYLDTSTPEGVRANFVGIPVVVDDEIESLYFELEY